MINIDNISKIQNIVKAVADYPNLPWKDAWSSGQVSSKMWILNELDNLSITSFERVYVIAGWLGVLPWLLLNNNQFAIEKIRSFDIDPQCQPAADRLNSDDKINDWKFKAVTADAMKMNFSKEGMYEFTALKANGNYSDPSSEYPDCIINTSCDHFSNLSEWITSLPQSSLLILQNTNHAHDSTHVNCVENLDQFVTQTSLKTILYSGSLDTGFSKRFMIIGYR